MKVKLIFLFTSYLLVMRFDAKCQNQYNVWYFGDHAGLDFNSGVPVALTNSSMSSYEGCAVMCDSAGNIMFYTNGGDINAWSGGVWNRNHVLMPNGNLNGFSGCNSTVQSSLIIPDPVNSNLYYLFTLDCFENSFAGGFRFSVIDMSLDGGNGDITIKDSLIDTAMCEAMCGIRHSNGTDFWVVVHKLGTIEFKSFLVNSSGIQLPVSTFTGIVPHDISVLKANASSDKICYVEVNGTGLFDFDNSTGIISNYIDLGKYSIAASFAPAGAILYIIEHSSPRRIVQFDLTAANIPAAFTNIDSMPVISAMGGMMLARDCKIYVAKSSSFYLDAINYPDVPGTGCGYTPDAVYLGGMRSENQLPNNIDGLFASLCNGVNVEELSTDMQFHLYPNPAQDYFYAHINLQGPAELKLVNAFGQEVTKIIFKEKSVHERIGMEPFPAGIYFAELRTANGIYTKKILKL